MSNLNETLELMKQAQAMPDENLTKGITQGTGLVAYDLQPVALHLYPFGEMMTPLRSSLPRLTSNAGDTATRWKAISNLNVNQVHAGVSEGNRGGIVDFTVVDKTAPYCGMGLESSATYESDYASQSFDDVKARAVESALRSLMIAEEKAIFGGNSTVNLGTTPTPTTALVAGGSLPDGTYNVIAVALTHNGMMRSSVASGLTATVSRTNADGSSDTIKLGVAQKSAAGTARTTSGSNNSISATVTPVNGALGYAFYIGVSGSERLAKISTINSVVLTELNASGQLASALPSADNSAEGSYSFDGILYQTAFTANSGAYVKTLATGTAGTGTSLTSDGAGGVSQITEALQHFWDTYKVSPDTIWCSAKELNSITKLVIGGGGAPLFRFNGDANTAKGQISGGASVGSMLNSITQQLLEIKVHPNAVAGTIMFTSKSIPYPLSGVGNVLQMKCRRDYYQLEWPMVTRKYQYGVYFDATLQCYFPPAFGIITNIS